MTARRLALDVLVRIETEGAYANLATNAALDRADHLDDRDRRFVTELVYGTTRMRRACDHLVDRHRRGGVEDRVAAALRLGAYQLAFADVPPHAAVAETVAAVPKRARGLVNAVLRRVADDVAAGIDWPDAGTELSCPDWIVAELGRRLGPDAALAAVRAMNDPATTHVRDDGYVQDPASQAVVDRVATVAPPASPVLDLCAGPGGKATGLAAAGLTVVGADVTQARSRLVARNATRTGHAVPAVCADGTAPPFGPATFGTVLVDAPCSGLGVLRRRPDARWRIDAGAPERLAVLQRRLLGAAADLVRPGGVLAYSVCTLTDAEIDGVVDAWAGRDAFTPIDAWERPPDADGDGMHLTIWRRHEVDTS